MSKLLPGSFSRIPRISGGSGEAVHTMNERKSGNLGFITSHVNYGEFGPVWSSADFHIESKLISRNDIFKQA